MPCNDPQRIYSYQRAERDLESIYGCDEPAPYQLIEQLQPLPFQARGCRYYLMFFLENGLITLDVADLVLQEIAPPHWECRHFPQTWIASISFSFA